MKNNHKCTMFACVHARECVGEVACRRKTWRLTTYPGKNHLPSQTHGDSNLNQAPKEQVSLPVVGSNPKICTTTK